MKLFLSFLFIVTLLPLQLCAAGFPVQNYGNDFMNSFNNTQQMIQQQQQIDDNRERQRRSLRLEEQRLENERLQIENERIRLENEKNNAAKIENKSKAEWTAAAIDFYESHPEYENNNTALESLKTELKTISVPGNKYQTYESKIALLEKAHRSLKEKEKNQQAWNQFIKRNPDFSDQESKQRKYGDYLFETEYNNKINNGEITYSQALDIVAIETYKVTGRNTPTPAPEIGPPRATK